MPSRRPTASGLTLALNVIGLYVLVAAAVYFVAARNLGSPVDEPEALAFNDTTVRAFCSGCHMFPEPDILPRAAWWQVVNKMTKMPDYPAGLLPPDSLISWFEARAPLVIELPPEANVPETEPIRWQRGIFATDYAANYPFIANMQLIDIAGDARLELVASDMSHGMMLLGRPYEQTGGLERIAMIPNPAHLTQVDLDGDGLQDLVVGNLGSLPPMDHDLGTVEWLRRLPSQEFERNVLFEGLGRVADVRPADFDADGDWDLTVAEFGYRRTGQIGVLQNKAPKGAGPDFDLHQIDNRHGGIHTEITDLNDDGRLDIIAILAQEHEMVMAYLNQGDFVFEPIELYRAPHPAWGTSGMELVDLDADGDQDILLTNGDMFDDPSLKPFHGIQWLEQTGPLQFEPHRLALMYGAHRAATADLDGDGDLDIVACSFMPKNIFAEAQKTGLTFQSLIWLEQITPDEFIPHSLEQNRPQHSTLVLGDYDLDGDTDLVVGNAFFDTGVATGIVPAMEWWENLGQAADDR